METMEEDLKYPVAALEHFGLPLTKVPEGATKTADLLGTDGSGTFVVEVKSKEDSEEFLRRRHAAAITGEVLEEEHPVSRQNVMAGILRDAAKQLSATAAPKDFRLVVFNACGHHSDVQIEQAEATFYGSVDGVDLKSGETITIYFFKHNECFLLRDSLDALFVMTDWSRPGDRKVRLCLNPFSPRCDGLRSTAFFKAISPYVADPFVEEERGKALIVDGNVDRSDKKRVLRHLQEKYDRPKLIDLSGMTHYSASMFIPKDGDGKLPE